MYIDWGKNTKGVWKKGKGLLIFLVGYKFECLTNTKNSNAIAFQELSWNMSEYSLATPVSQPQSLLQSVFLKVAVPWMKGLCEKAMEDFLSNANTMLISLALY